jgi:iron(III) transport system substrate-binding protein
MKKYFKFALALACAAALVGCSGKQAPAKTAAPAAAQVAPAAGGVVDPNITGKVVIYTSMYQDIVDAMNKAVKTAFPKLDVNFFYGGTGQLQAKVAAEKASGKLGADMFMVAEPAYSLELMDAGMLEPNITKEASNLAFPYDKDGYWYPVRISNMVLAYNPQKYKIDQVAQSLKDFAYMSGLKGGISMSNPLTSGTALASISALFDKYGKDYFTALGKQQVKVESGSVAATKLQTGECKEVMILEESILKLRQEDQSPLTVIYPTDGTIVIPSTIMIVNDKWNANKNIPACKELEDWFLSMAGQTHIVDGWMHSVRKDFPHPPFDGKVTKDIVANSMPVNWQHCWKDRDTLRTMFQEAVMK